MRCWWVDFHPGLSCFPSLCSRTVFVVCASPFWRVGLLEAVCRLYRSSELYHTCTESDGASLLCPLEPSRRPRPCRLPSVARSLVHYGRGCAAGFRPR
jgi:hypothetical protein